MFRDHIRLIREYFKLAKLSKPLFGLTLLTACLYKAFAVILPIIAAQIIKALTEQNSNQTYFFIGLYALIYFLNRLTYFLNCRAYTWNVAYTYHSLQARVFEKLIFADHKFTKKISKGRLMNTVNTDVISIGEMNDEISEYITTIVQVIVILVIAATYNLPIALIMLISALIYLKVHDYSDKKYNIFWWKTQTEDDRYSNLIGQTLSGIQEVKTFNMLPKLKAKVKNIQTRYDKAYKAQRHYANIRGNDVKFIYYFFQTILYVVLLFMMSDGHLALDILVLLVSYHTEVINGVEDFCDAIAEIRLTNASIIRVNAILNYKGEQELKFGDLGLDDLNGAITFKNVSLKLENQTILKDINFKIHRHEFVAIVGNPGAGKTMLFNLLLRLNKPTKGKIYLDNTEISEFSRAVYSSNVAVANQSPFIFNMSIRKNLDFVDSDIRHQIEACKTAGIHDFIETLPQGYNTVLRENATNISGGQKQMISIARTILTDAEVLLLDDITTSLDPDTAKLVPRLIKKLDGERTIIMITKKPDLMKLADRIIVLDNGKISDSGTHEGLMKRSSIYRHLQINVSSANNIKGGGDV